ncbi:NAD-dependent epimerase [Brachybacterium endophyticum]|uniref:NAD-dependent epimerase n=1 Tax=Brachybacterium endophyticum TaxID=2182385 RepID=A0A2U2RNH4_9MICO|nr:NAD-dependent epimerase/dehydratase family protein [Brachybacterium endophyticum]PWH07381.1 NAD-dependent epimerase [Brachybacterium endophyticum]
MQTILGASGQIGTELAHALHDEFTTDLRLVSRHPEALHETDETRPADLLDAGQTAHAVEGSEIVYFTAGLPPDSGLWEQQLPTMMRNVIDACATHGARLVFFDNTYMYPKNAEPQTEQTTFEPVGRKAVVRARIAEMLLEAMDQKTVEAVICRAPEFYGPGKTQSFTNSLVFERIAAGKTPRVPLADDTRRSLIWTPDASRAMARIGNTPSAYGQTWHLPVDPGYPTYKALITDLAAEAWGRELRYAIMPKWQFTLGSLASKPMREMRELLPRYAVDNLFISTTFTEAFPDFHVTTYREGLGILAAESSAEGSYTDTASTDTASPDREETTR